MLPNVHVFYTLYIDRLRRRRRVVTPGDFQCFGLWSNMLSNNSPLLFCAPKDRGTRQCTDNVIMWNFHMRSRERQWGRERRVVS